MKRKQAGRRNQQGKGVKTNELSGKEKKEDSKTNQYQIIPKTIGMELIRMRTISLWK